MFTRFAVLALGLLLSLVESTPGVINSESAGIDINSDIGQHLLKHARKLQDGEGYDYSQNVDTSFLSGYSVKFQGCHHVQQWNEDASDEDDVRIMTKRLVRFRLCPSSDCGNDLTGCTSHYGDYVVDMETYVTAFMSNAYSNKNGGNRDLQDSSSYLECTEFNMRRHLDQNNANGQYNNYGYYGDQDVTYYVGPYCADQGGEIRLGLFTDDTCTSFAQSQYAIQGLPYTQKSMVSMSCMSCGSYGTVSDFCDGIYQLAGKCESKMSMYYPNEAACSYIEGIKIIREDGVIRTSATKKSKAATVAIGCFLTVAVLLAGYVYYLRTKLGRAKINLNAASQTL